MLCPYVNKTRSEVVVQLDLLGGCSSYTKYSVEGDGVPGGLIDHAPNKMATVRFTTIPCEPNTANRHKESHIFLEIHPVLTTLCMAGLELLQDTTIF